MKEFLREDIIDHFNDGLFEVIAGDLVDSPVTGVYLRRNDELDLIFELTSPGWSKDKPDPYPAGTVRRAEGVIEFRHLGGSVATARGVIERGTRSSSKRTGEAETVTTYSAHSVELTLPESSSPAYVIEWVSNLPDGFIWTEPVSFSTDEATTKIIGRDGSEFRMTGSAKSSGGSKALHLRVSGADAFVMHSVDADTAKGRGQIAYRSCPDQAFRDKLRACASFILGKPIVYLGHTEYSEHWQAIRMRSVDAVTTDGGAFKLHDLPPYPINDARYANVIDQNRVSAMIKSLFDQFDVLKLNELFWSYWYAACAPIHAAPAQFGSLIEQLQNTFNRVGETKRSELLEAQAWQSLNGVIKAWLDVSNLNPQILSILKGKLASLNQAPQSLVLERLLDGMDMRTSDAEAKAWKHRNIAAHGGFPNDPIPAILDRKILQILLHRLLAGITSCSELYIDYYNLGHPIRGIREPVPERP